MKNVNVAEMMSIAENKAFVANFEAALEKDTEAVALMEKSNSVEDMFTVASKYFQIKLEDFKEAYHKAVDYLTQPKAKLDDDIMDCVAGGGIGDWFKKHWKTVVAVAVGVVGVAVGVLTCGVGAALASSMTVAMVTHTALCGSLAIAGGAGIAGSFIYKDVKSH